MKKYIFLTLLFSGIVNAQVSIANLEDTHNRQPHVYYSDSQNFLGPLAGTYLYQEAGRTFKIVLNKKQNSNRYNTYYQDMLIGGYQYNDGNIQIDLLNDLENNFACGCSHVIYFQHIRTGPAPGCLSCTPNQKWMVGVIADPVANSADAIFLIPHIVNGQAAIRILINHEIRVNFGNNPTASIHYPIGGEEFILLKQ